MNLRPQLLCLVASVLLLAGCNMYFPGSPISKPRSTTTKHLADARQFREQGLNDSALAALSLALEDNPKLTEAHMGMGDIYRERGDYDLARLRYEEAAAIEPNNFKAHYNHGLMQQILGDANAAIQTYLKALSISPQDFQANRDIASSYLQLGQPDIALPYARLATKVNPDSQPAWSNLAATYSLLGKYEQAIDAYRTANELGELADPVLLGLADAHIRLGNYPRAINTLNSLVLSSPSATAHERLGYAQFKMRRFEDALDQYEIALTLDPNDTSALNGAGAAYMTLYIEGERENRFQKERAVECWRKSINVKPEQSRIIDLLARYGRL